MTHLARVAIRRLRTGIVPRSELERLSVGLDEVRDIVDEALSALIQGNSPVSLFVRGEWGTGKSHLLSFARKVGETCGVPTAGIILNARSLALTHPQRFYPDLMKSIRAKGGNGLRSVLSALLEDDETRVRLHAFANTSFAGDLKEPLLSLCEAWKDRDSIGLQDHPAWRILLGADLSWADYAYKRAVALARISSIVFLFRAVRLSGLVFTVDEVETIDQLWNIRSRLAAYGVLGRLCRSPGIWCVFGITERFDRTVVADLDRGVLKFDDLDDNAAWFLRSWRDGAFSMTTPPSVDVDSARVLAKAVAALYKDAYSDTGSDKDMLERCLKEWSRNPNRNPRRLIRLLVENIDMSRRLAPAKLTFDRPASAL